MWKQIIITVIIAIIIRTPVYSQESEILGGFVMLDQGTTSKEKVLDEISQKTGLVFSYSQELHVHESFTVNYDSKQKVSDVLVDLFGTSIQWKVMKDKIVLRNFNTNLGVEKNVDGFAIDAVTLQPLIGASIRLKNSKPLVGTTTNTQGYFKLQFRSEEMAKDTIVISHMGYEPYFIIYPDKKGDNIFRLTNKSIALNEILVEWTNPKEILLKSIKKIRTNYADKPSQIRAFYRESLRRNAKYMTYVEGLLDIYKCAYRPSLSTDQAKLIQLRRFSNIQSTDTVIFKLQGGVDAVMKLDLVRKPLPFISTLTLDKYDYDYNGVETYDNKPVYRISFHPNIDFGERDYSGYLLIDTTSHAFRKIVFNLNAHHMNDEDFNLVMSAKPNLQIEPSSIRYEVDYRQVGDKYIVNHISGNMSMKVRRKKKLLNSKYNLQFEMYTTDVMTKNVKRFDREEKLMSRQIFYDINTPSLIADFYKSNTIQELTFPEKDLLKALGKFKVEELTFVQKFD